MKGIIIFLILSLLFSCGLDAQLEIVEHQIALSNKTSTDKKVYLEFNLDDYLINFLTENRVVADVERNNNDRWLTIEEVRKIFNKNEVSYLIGQIENNKLKTNEISLPKNIVIKTDKDVLNPISQSNIYRITLSTPAITNDGQYALIGFAQGHEGALGGGVNIYKKSSGKWEYYTTLDLWIE